MGAVRNQFAESWVGSRYAEARPDVHATVADGIFRHVGRVPRALDLGCGTGLSTRALLPHATRVVGLDPSASMLRAGVTVAAPSHAAFIRGRAESLPFEASEFQLVTIGCAYHWCNREQLFAEADRVLSRAGWLAIFDSEFLGLVESPALLEWLRNDYWPRLPPCPRNPLFEASQIQPPFGMVAQVSTEAHVPMTAEAILLLITTQASTVNAVTSGVASLSELEERLRRGLRSNFPDEESGGSGRSALARFSNPLWLLRKAEQDTRT